MQAARRQLLALCPTTLRALNGVQLTEDETRLVSLKHRQESGTAVAPATAPSALHRAPWRRHRSTATDRPASAAAALPGGAVTGRGSAHVKRSAGGGAGRAGAGVVRPAAGRGAGKGPASPGVEWKDEKSVVMQGDAVSALKVRLGFLLAYTACARSLATFELPGVLSALLSWECVWIRWPHVEPDAPCPVLMEEEDDGDRNLWMVQYSCMLESSRPGCVLGFVATVGGYGM